MPDAPPSRAWKIASAGIVIAITAAVLWVVEWRSQAPPPPKVTLPYTPPQPAGR